MVERRAAEAAEAMAGTIVAGDPHARWRGCALDSRRIAGGEIFFALPGERADGHDFLPDAVRRGAGALVVHREVEPAGDGVWVRVEDTYRALHALTRAVRATVPEKLVGITGSAGKTTTKEILAAMLGRRYRVAKSPGNLNNLYGFPLSLLNAPDDCEWMVAEMGMSTPGELRGVSLLGRPDVAVFTNVRPAHLENFDSVRGIARAKAELLAGLAPGGLVVVNADDPEVVWIAERHRREHPGAARYLTYGVENPAAVRAYDLEPLQDRAGSRFVLEAGGERIAVELSLHGLYNVENALAAAACAHALGVPLAEIAAAAATLEPGEMRGRIHRLPGLTVIDDSYNSNPDAAKRALESARRLAASRYVAVLGEMLELGPTAPELHRQVGERAAELGFAVVVGVGELAREILTAASAGGVDTHRLADAAEAARWAAAARRGGRFGDGALVLVKGSRGVGLETVVEALVTTEEED